MANFSWVKPLVTFAQTASFIVPEPAGALLSGGLGVLGMYIGGDNRSQLANLLDDAVSQMNSVTVEEQLRDATATIKDYTDWLSGAVHRLQELVEGTASDPMTSAQLLSKAHDTLSDDLEHLDQAAVEGSAIRHTLNLLCDASFLDLKAVNWNWDIFIQAWKLLNMGVGVYLTHLRLRAQYLACLDSSTDKLFDRYGQFHDEALEWCDKLDTWPPKFKQTFLDMITGVGPYQISNADGGLFNPLRVALGEGKTESGFEWRDYGDSDPAHSWRRFPTEAEATAARDQRVKEVTAQQDANWQDDIDGIAQMRAATETWKVAKLVPRTPAAAPGVAPSTRPGMGLSGQAPWVAGNQVSYAVYFKNSSGSSGLGPWSPPFELHDQLPVLSDIPVDPFGVATARAILRKVTARDSNGSPTDLPLGVAAIIPDNTSTNYEDAIPPPPPTKAPQVVPNGNPWGAVSGVKPWMAGTRVRYAVSFTNPSGASKLGPWSDPFEISSRYPLITDIPLALNNTATSREILRIFAFRQSDGSYTDAPMDTAGSIADNSATTFEDGTEGSMDSFADQ